MHGKTNVGKEFRRVYVSALERWQVMKDLFPNNSESEINWAEQNITEKAD